MMKINLNGVAVNIIDVEANQKLGFNFPFKIVIPENLNENPELVYACNLTQDRSNECNTFDEMIELTKDDLSGIDPIHRYLCLSKGYPMIIPTIPRTKEFRPNFLGKDCYYNDFKKLEDSKFKDSIHLYNNLADQHKAIIDFASKTLNESGINVDDKVIISGYSEGAKFASHYSLLHPESVKMVIAGGTGGVMSMPIKNKDGYDFNYPTGINDVSNFDFDSFQKIAFFYYMGDKDKSDSAIPNFETYHYIDENGNDTILKDECGNKTVYIDEDGKQQFILDKNGNYTSKFNLYSDEEVNAINKVLGTVTQDRFKKQEQIYNDLGLNSKFKLYPGNHRTIFENENQIFNDIDVFLEENLDKKCIK